MSKPVASKKVASKNVEVVTATRGFADVSMITDMKFSNADVVSIVTARAESSFKADITKLNAEIKSLTASATEKVTKLEEINQATADEALAKRKGIAIDVAKNWYEGRELKSALDRIKICATTGNASIYCSFLPSFSIEVEITDEQKNLQKGIDKIKKDIYEVGRKVSALQAKLADIPSIERKATAELTAHGLTKTAQGQDLLDKVDGILSGLKIDCLEDLRSEM